MNSIDPNIEIVYESEQQTTEDFMNAIKTIKHLEDNNFSKDVTREAIYKLATNYPEIFVETFEITYINKVNAFIRYYSQYYNKIAMIKAYKNLTSADLRTSKRETEKLICDNINCFDTKTWDFELDFAVNQLKNQPF